MGKSGEPRLGYVVAEFPSSTETFIANEISGLIHLGVDVTVFALRRGGGDETAGCRVVYRADRAIGAGSTPLPYLRAIWLASSLERAHPRTLAACIRNVGAARRFAAAAEAAGIRHLHAHFADVPTDIALMMASMGAFSVSFSAHAHDIFSGRPAIGRKLRRAALCITCTQAGRRRVEALTRGKGTDRVKTICHGTDLTRFRYRPPGEAGKPARVLAVGRLVPKKGFGVLLHACRLLAGRMPLRCDIVGDGPLRAKLHSLADELGLQECVSFAGSQPYVGMPRLYELADVVCVPSVRAADGDQDGLPNVVVEAMACGVPVVASRLSGIPEAVDDGRTGLLCQPGDSVALADALQRAIADNGLRSRCVDAARKVVEERFDAAANARLVHDALRVAARQA